MYNRRRQTDIQTDTDRNILTKTGIQKQRDNYGSNEGTRTHTRRDMKSVTRNNRNEHEMADKVLYIESQ